MHKKNCWEVMNCGRGPDDAGVGKDRTMCPTALEYRLHGVHGGKQAGRACWVVAGTFCDGKTQGVFAKKYDSCKHCRFYKRVLDEENSKFELTLSLMKRLRKVRNLPPGR